MKLYVQAKSKKALNERLAAGDAIIGINHSMFGDGGSYDLDTVPTGTTIAIWDKAAPKEFGGNPIAKAWGTWNADKRRVL